MRREREAIIGRVIDMWVGCDVDWLVGWPDGRSIGWQECVGW